MLTFIFNVHIKYEEQLLEMDNHVQLMPEESTQLWKKNMI